MAEGNYTKRKHVFKLVSLPNIGGGSSSSVDPSGGGGSASAPQSPTIGQVQAVAAGTELLIQTDGPQAMRLWMKHLLRAAEADEMVSERIAVQSWL